MYSVWDKMEPVIKSPFFIFNVSAGNAAVQHKAQRKAKNFFIRRGTPGICQRKSGAHGARRYELFGFLFHNGFDVVFGIFFAAAAAGADGLFNFTQYAEHFGDG